MLGCFGEALLRKFGEEPPQEWVGAFSSLDDRQLARGFRRLLASGKSAPPSLPEFMRLCKALSDDSDEAPRVVALPPPESKQDDWDVRSNELLFAYIRKKPNIREAWGAPDSRALAQVTGVLVKHKKAWAAMMRGWDVDRETGEIEIPPAADQNIAWKRAMEAAEAEVAQAKLDETSRLMQNWYGGAQVAQP